METRIFIMDLLTIVCIPIYAEDDNIEKLKNDYLEFESQEIDYLKNVIVTNTSLSASYQFTNWASVDTMIMPLEADEKINYRLGITFIPIEGLQLRLYGGLILMPKATDLNSCYSGYINCLFIF